MRICQRIPTVKRLPTRRAVPNPIIRLLQARMRVKAATLVKVGPRVRARRWETQDGVADADAEVAGGCRCATGGCKAAADGAINNARRIKARVARARAKARGRVRQDGVVVVVAAVAMPTQKPKSAGLRTAIFLQTNAHRSNKRGRKLNAFAKRLKECYGISTIFLNSFPARNTRRTWRKQKLSNCGIRSAGCIASRLARIRRTVRTRFPRSL